MGVACCFIVVSLTSYRHSTEAAESSLKGALSHPEAISATAAQPYGERFVGYLSKVLRTLHWPDYSASAGYT